MFTELGTELMIILALILANGFFAGSELAVVSARRGRLEQRAREGRSAASQAIALAENPDRFLAAVQVGITLISTFAAAFGGVRMGAILAGGLREIPAVASYAETLALALVVLFITYLSLVFGELVPKRLALRHTEGFAMLAAPIMTTLATLARPVIAILTGSVSLVLRALRQQPSGEGDVEEEDIVYLVQEGVQSGAVEAGEAHFIRRVFAFTDRPVRAVMRPRTEITAVPDHISVEAAGDIVVESGYSRLPVYQQSLDQIIGILYAKDLFPILRGRQPAPDSIRQLLRPATFVLAYQPIDDVLALMRRQGAHMAIAIDEYGGVDGLITLEDILEELVGEIRDEHDISEERPIVQRADGSWLVDGLEPYDRVCEELGLPALVEPERVNFTTIAGLLVSNLGHIPEVGEQLTLGGYRFEIMDMDGRRIDKILIQRLPPAATAPAENEQGP